jgi:hypothetical protein
VCLLKLAEIVSNALSESTIFVQSSLFNDAVS